MGRILETDVIGCPTRWMLVFDREAASPWTNFIACGRYKHVRAFGYVHAADAFVFYDVQFGGTSLQIARGDAARALMMEWTANADVLRYDGEFSTVSNGFALVLTRFSRPFLCTTAIAHLLGLPGALRPDALYRQCLRNGAEVVYGSPEASPGAARPDAGPADANGEPAAADGHAGRGRV